MYISRKNKERHHRTITQNDIKNPNSRKYFEDIRDTQYIAQESTKCKKVCCGSQE